MVVSDINPKEGPVLLFDGLCQLCSKSVQFILSHEKDQQLRFASLQSSVGKGILEQIEATPTSETLVYYSESGIETYSSAALACTRHLRAPWRWFSILRFIPVAIRDFIYRQIAKNRYNWFGRRDVCFIPDQQSKHRFLS